MPFARGADVGGNVPRSCLPFAKGAALLTEHGGAHELKAVGVKDRVWLDRPGPFLPAV